MYKDLLCFTGIAFTYIHIILQSLQIQYKDTTSICLHVVLLFVCLHVVCITYIYTEVYI